MIKALKSLRLCFWKSAPPPAPVVEAQEEKEDKTENWTVNLTTYSRDEMIDLSVLFGQALPADMFQNSEHIPLIAVIGNGGCGKSLMVEAMMKTLLDEHDPESMKADDASKSMFLEETSSHATWEYLSVSGQIHGHKASLAFDRFTVWEFQEFPSDEDFQSHFQKHAKGKDKKKTGAIFITDRTGTFEANPWIKILIDSEPLEWDKKIEITIHAPLLQSDPDFRQFWDEFRSHVETGQRPSFLERAAPETRPP